MTARTEGVTLLDNASETGAEQLLKLGGRYTASVSGTFGGATVQLQFLGPDGVTWIDVPSGSATANAALGPYAVASGTRVRAAVSGGAPSALYCVLARAGGGE